MHGNILKSGRAGNTESLQTITVSTRMKVREGGIISCTNPAGASQGYTVEWPATAVWLCAPFENVLDS